MSLFDDFDEYDGLGLADLVRRGRVSARRLLDTAMERIERRNPRVNAVVLRLYEQAQRAIAIGLPRGPFTGVPFLMKDLSLAMTEAATTRGSVFFADTPPADTDSVHVTRLRSAGLVLAGRTNTCEMGLSLTCEPKKYGATRNPWDLERSSGGSSGGAAAAVASRMVPMAHAADGFGSIRVPAACCGLVGLKPSRARGTFAPFAGDGLAGLAVEHAVTRTVRDCAALLDVTSGASEGDPYVAPPPAGSFLAALDAEPAPLRIGWTDQAFHARGVDTGCADALSHAVSLLRSLGHSVEQCVPKALQAELIPTFRMLAATNVATQLRSHPQTGRRAGERDVEKVTFRMFGEGESARAVDFLDAIRTTHRLGREMAEFHRDFDVLLTPALARQPPPLGWIDMSMDDVDEYWRRVFELSPYTLCFNMTGQPAISVPLAMVEGLPFGIQLVAPYGGEATLLKLAGQLEKAAPMHGQKPSFVEQRNV